MRCLFGHQNSGLLGDRHMRRQISKYSLVLFLMLPFAQSSYAKTTTPPDTEQNAPYVKDYAAAKKFQLALKKNDRQAVANLVHFPLLNEKPLASIRNSKEFLARWDEYFDSTTIPTVLAANALDYGWRGIALTGGIVWFDKGRISSINLETPAYKAALSAAKKMDDSKLYVSARGYDSISFQCSTKKLFVRAQKHGDDLRYFAWKKGASLLTKPELELVGGKYDPQGTGGNFDLEFRKEDFTYTVSVGHNLCGEDCNDYLVVSQGDKKLSNEVCTEVSP